MYQKFNTLIFDHFFKTEGIGNAITLSIDDEVITKIADKLHSSKEELLNSIRDYLKDDWEKILIPGIDGIPQYLGLIAVQVYAAHLMQKKEGEYTEKAYLPHLNQLFGFEGNNKIEHLFKKYQDKIWKNLKEWVLERGFDFHLPMEKKRGYRYVQYPLSHALLNKEDLERVPILFQEAGIRPNEEFSLEDFTTAAFPAPCGKLTPHFYKVYKKYPEGVQRQIFKYYQIWDGNIPEILRKDKKISSQHCKENTDELVLERGQNIDIYIVDIYNDKKAEFSLDNPNLFSEIGKFYNMPHKDIIIFKQDLDYEDWVATRYIHFNISCIALIRKDHLDANILADQFRKIAKNDYSSRLYHLFELQINDTVDIAEPIKKYFSKSKNKFTLQNGLKLGRKIWMEGAGPDIIFERENIRWWLDGERKEKNKFSCRDLPVGEHSIKIPDNTPVKFFVEAPKEKISNLKTGWNVSASPPLWASASETPVIKGLILATSDEKEDVSIVRQWADSLMNTGEKRQNVSLPVVVNAIRRKYNGIRK